MQFLHLALLFQAKMRFSINLTNNEYESVKLKSQVSGFCSISAFVREKLLKNNLVTETKIKEIYDKIVKKNGTHQTNNNRNEPITKSAHSK